jgi:hypothetical protein
VRVEIPRSRPTVPQPVPGLAARVKVLAGVALLAVLVAMVSTTGAVLFGLGALLGSLSLLVEWQRYLGRKRRYAQGYGAILDDTGVTFYDDWGPTTHPWANFGEARVSRLDDRPIVQHLAVRDVHLTGYERFSSYILSPIDFLDLAPEEVVRVLKSHPCFPGDRTTG